MVWRGPCSVCPQIAIEAQLPLRCGCQCQELRQWDLSDKQQIMYVRADQRR